MIALILLAAIQTTTCNTFGGSTTCTTTPPPTPSYEVFNRAFEAASRREPESEEERQARIVRLCGGPRSWLSICTGAERREAAALIAAAEARAALRTRVTDLLAAEDCPGAVRAALQGGDMDLAREARDFCSR